MKKVISLLAIYLFSICFVSIGAYAITIDFDGTNDTYSQDQYYIEKIRIFNVWMDIPLYNRKNVNVAIIDDGIYQNHPDLVGKLWSNSDEIAGNGVDDDGNGYIDDTLGYNFLSYTSDVTQTGPHGTAVAGIIAANRDNGIGVAGITKYATLMPLIACDANGCPNDAIIEAIYYAVNNEAQVINISLGTYKTNGFTTDFDEAVKYAYENNVVLIVASGNGDVNGQIGYDLTAIPQSPVCNDNDENMIIGVGASTKEGDYRTNWSNYGNCVDLFAPGEEITTTYAPEATDNYLYSQEAGSSFSAPIVTGLVVEALSSFHDLSNTAINNYLTEASTDSATKGNVDAYTFIFNILSERQDANYKNEDVFTGEKYYYNPYSKVVVTSDDEMSNVTTNAGEVLFSDVAESDKNFNAISYLKEHGIINGYSDGTFKPTNSVNRAELLKILIEGKGVKPTIEEYNSCFKDVKEGWYVPYVCYAKSAGWVKGYTDGTFKPGQVVVKVEAIKMLLNSQEVYVPEFVSNKPFDDVDSSEWFATFVSKAKELGVLEETGNLYSPNTGMTRAGICENIYRLLTK